MTTTPPDAAISDSWVDLSGQMVPTTPPGAMTPRRITPVPFGGEHDYLRMLREAQRESNRSSTKVSPISSALISGRNTPSMSPKSPPNTPNPELASLHEELKAVYVNRVDGDSNHGGHSSSGNGGGGHVSLTASDIMWDWTSRPNIPHNREWTFPSARSRKSSASSKLSIRNAKFGKRSLFSKEVMYTLVITNLVSLLIGAGIGMWLSRRGVDEEMIVEIGL